MSYRDPNQALEKPIQDIIDAMDTFVDAARRRIASGDWNTDHEDRLMSLSREMMKMSLELERLKRETW